MENNLELLEQELSACFSTHGPSHPETAEAMNSLGLFYHHVVCDQEKALEYHNKALHVLMREESVTSHVKQIAETMADIGNAYGKMGKTEIANAFYSRALCVYKISGARENYHRVMSIKNRMMHGNRVMECQVEDYVRNNVSSLSSSPQSVFALCDISEICKLDL